MGDGEQSSGSRDMEAPSPEGDHELGRVLDPAELERSNGPRARLRIEIPEAWTTDEGGLDLLVNAPARLVCARCDGGGCDGCGRSGALLAPRDARSRVVRTCVGPSSLASSSVLVRISRPFGDAGLDQLLLEVVVADAASAGVTRVASSRALAPTARPRAVAWRAAVVAAVVALVAVFLELARGR